MLLSLLAHIREDGDNAAMYRLVYFVFSLLRIHGSIAWVLVFQHYVALGRCGYFVSCVWGGAGEAKRSRIQILRSSRLIIFN